MVGTNLKAGTAPLLRGLVMTGILVALSACGSTEKSSGQSLVRIDGQEITISQLNEELARINIPAAQRDAASKQLLESLIDRQLLQNQAAKDKVDRDPAVVQAIERAKAQIIAQSYLQKRLAKVGKPTQEDIDKYYLDHPDFFAERRIFEFDQVVMANKDVTPDLRKIFGAAKSLDEVMVYVKAHKIQFETNTLSRSTVDLPAPLTAKLKDMQSGQVLALQEGDRTIAVMIKSIKFDPALPATADPQIGKFLMEQRNKDATAAEITRLRAGAKIEYLNKKVGDKEPAATAPAPADQPKAEVKRGVGDL